MENLPRSGPYAGRAPDLTGCPPAPYSTCVEAKASPMDAPVDNEEADQGRDRRLGGRHRHGDPCPGDEPRRSSSPAPRPPSAASRTSHVSLVDAAMPGMLPVINEECVPPGDPHRPRPQGADQPRAASSTARTTSIRTCRRATRSASTRARSSARARSSSTSPTARRSRSASSACISSRTPASRSTTSTRP